MVSKTKISASSFFNCRIPVFLVVEDIVDCRAVSLSSVRSRVRVVVVVARQRSQKFEMVKFIRPTTRRRYPGLGTCLRHQLARNPFSVAATIRTNKLSFHTQQGFVPTFSQDGIRMSMYSCKTHCHHPFGHFRPRARLRATNVYHRLALAPPTTTGVVVIYKILTGGSEVLPSLYILGRRLLESSSIKINKLLEVI